MLASTSIHMWRPDEAEEARGKDNRNVKPGIDRGIDEEVSSSQPSRIR